MKQQQQQTRIEKAAKVVGAKLKSIRESKGINYSDIKRSHGIHRDQCIEVENGLGHNRTTLYKYIDSIAGDDKQKWINNLGKVIDLIFEV